MKKVLVVVLFALFSCLNSFSQSIPNGIENYKLPYTWEAPMGNMGKMICTLHTNGKITSQMITMCMNCGGYGVCQVCHGTGGQYWYGIGMQPCGSCFGSGRCRACNGKGYSVIQTSTTDSGLTIGWDEHGNYYVAAGGLEKSERVRTKGVYNCCSGVPTFGLKATYHKCSNCGKVHEIGTHKCVRK